LEAFLDAGAPPVYVGFGSMRRVSEDIARVAVEAIRAQGRRVLVSRGWADGQHRKPHRAQPVREKTP
jgi:vancomycin aglycone glucosyltransferase